MVFFIILTANLINVGGFLINLLGANAGTTIGGQITEVVSAAPSSTETKDTSFLTSFQAILTASVGSNNIASAADTDMESTPYDTGSEPIITGQDSILPNQNPITTPMPAPAPKLVAPYYTAGPYLEGYFIFPTEGYNHGKLHTYNAVDISHGTDCITDNIPVFAAASGIVSQIFPTESTNRYAHGGYGNNILILHPNGVLTRYAHLKEILVSSGQYVNQGAVIANMGGYPGMIGAGNSTGCHLHFEVRGAKNPFVR